MYNSIKHRLHRASCADRPKVEPLFLPFFPPFFPSSFLINCKKRRVLDRPNTPHPPFLSDPCGSDSIPAGKQSLSWVLVSLWAGDGQVGSWREWGTRGFCPTDQGLNTGFRFSDRRRPLKRPPPGPGCGRLGGVATARLTRFPSPRRRRAGGESTAWAAPSPGVGVRGCGRFRADCGGLLLWLG